MRDKQRSQRWRDTVAQKQAECVERDSTVAPRHKDYVRSNMTSMSAGKSTDRIETRSMSRKVHEVTSIETVRSSVSPSPDIRLSLDLSSLNPEADPYQPSPPACPSSSGLISDIPGCTDTDNSSDSDDSTGIVDNDCHNDLCAYGSYPHVRNSDNVFLCTKCSQQDKLYVCATCLGVGGHQRHISYLKQLTLDT